MLTARMSLAEERAAGIERQMRPRGTVAHVAEDLVGLHASRQSGPYVACRARLKVPASGRPQDHGDLLLLRAMRGTLHALPAGGASVLHAAFAEQRRKAENAALARAGRTSRGVTRARAAVCERLSDGPLEEGQALAICDRATLRALWAQAAFLVADQACSPLRRRRVLHAPSRFPDWAPPPAPAAREAVAAAYLAAYGPASREDLIRWAGWGARRTDAALRRLRGRLVAVEVPGLPGPLLCLDDRPRPLPPGQRPGRVSVLAYEDPAIKAYWSTRERYLQGVPALNLFWHAGESLACVLLDGVLVATWTWSAASGRASLRPLRPLKPADQAAVRSAVDATADWLAACNGVDLGHPVERGTTGARSG